MPLTRWGHGIVYSLPQFRRALSTLSNYKPSAADHTLERTRQDCSANRVARYLSKRESRWSGSGRAGLLLSLSLYALTRSPRNHCQPIRVCDGIRLRGWRCNPRRVPSSSV
jgi:hypothetical protein